MKKTLVFLLVVVLFSGFLLVIDRAEVRAQTAASTNPQGSSGGLDNPLGENDFDKVVNRAITYILGLVGVLALIAFIYGGVEWMISAGDTAKIKKGKDMMVWSVWGIVIIFASYAILKFVFDVLLGAKQ